MQHKHTRPNVQKFEDIENIIWEHIESAFKPKYNPQHGSSAMWQPHSASSWDTHKQNNLIKLTFLKTKIKDKPKRQKKKQKTNWDA